MTASAIPSLHPDTPMEEAVRLALVNSPEALPRVKAMIAEVEAAGGPAAHAAKLAAEAAEAKAKAEAEAAAAKAAKAG